MRKVFLEILACVLLVASAQAQGDGGRQMVVPVGEGFVAFRLEAVRAGAQTSANTSHVSELETMVTPQVLVDDEQVIHRALVDREGNFIFGYDLIVKPMAQSKQFMVAVRPLNPAFEQQLRARNSSSAPAATTIQHVNTFPRAAEEQLIDDGDAFSLDLLVNSTTGVKIVDIVKLSFDRSRLWDAPAGFQARDFTLDNVELAVRDYKLTVNRKLVGGGRPTRGVSGALLWFYVQNKGRFIFSLTPRAGYDFQKIGVIDGNRISFVFDGNFYEWTSSTPILAQGGAWNLWVLYDPDYVPDFSVASEAPLRPVNNQREHTRLPSRLPAIQESDIRTWSGALPRITIESQDSEPVMRNARVMVGAADRMENLMPKRPE